MLLCTHGGKRTTAHLRKIFTIVRGRNEHTLCISYRRGKWRVWNICLDVLTLKARTHQEFDKWPWGSFCRLSSTRSSNRALCTSTSCIYVVFVWMYVQQSQKREKRTKTRRAIQHYFSFSVLSLSTDNDTTYSTIPHIIPLFAIAVSLYSQRECTTHGRQINESGLSQRHFIFLDAHHTCGVGKSQRGRYQYCTMVPFLPTSCPSFPLSRSNSLFFHHHY